MRKKIISKETIGAFCVFASAFCIYMMSVFMRWSRQVVDLDATYYLLTRFIFTFLIIGAIFLIKGKSLRPRNFKLVLARSFTYVAGVYCFFKAIELTSAAEANILHMTLPLYIALFYFLINKGRKDYVGYMLTMIAFIGVWLIISPGNLSFKIESLWGVASGAIGAVAIICLHLARRYDDTDTILFYMFGLGSILTYILFPEAIHLPNGTELKYLLSVASLGALGQYLLTLGFKYVTAVEGGIIASTRILLAAVLGPFLVSDPQLTLGGWIGALMIFGTNMYLTIRKIGYTGTQIPSSKEQVGTMI